VPTISAKYFFMAVFLDEMHPGDSQDLDISSIGVDKLDWLTGSLPPAQAAKSFK
jgi:hypothetical protein